MTKFTNRGQDNWTPKTGNAPWQKERMRRPVFAPMYRTGFLARLFGRVR